MNNVEQLKQTIKEKYLRRGEFILSSGEETNTYFDIKGLMGNWEDRLLLKDVINQHLFTGKHYEVLRNINSFAGIELGGVILAMLLGHTTCFIRKTPRDHGLKKMVEGQFRNPVLLIDDVITTSHSVANAVQVCINEGIDIIGVMCVIDRRQVLKTADRLCLLGMDNTPNGLYQTRFYSLFHEREFI